jgi:hypothetical protein
LGFLLIQGTSRKLTHPQHPGAWAGTIAIVSPDGIIVRCSQEKWDKAKHYLVKLLACVESSKTLDYRYLKSVRGFFIHLQHTYPALMPFIKGLYLMAGGIAGTLMLGNFLNAIGRRRDIGTWHETNGSLSNNLAQYHHLAGCNQPHVYNVTKS